MRQELSRESKVAWGAMPSMAWWTPSPRRRQSPEDLPSSCGRSSARRGRGPACAILPVARQRSANRDNQAAAGVDDHLVGGGVAVVLGLFGHLVVAGGHQRAVHDEHGVLGEPLGGPER